MLAEETLRQYRFSGLTWHDQDHLGTDPNGHLRYRTIMILYWLIFCIHNAKYQLLKTTESSRKPHHVVNVTEGVANHHNNPSFYMFTAIASRFGLWVGALIE